ncbi:hypothetical protein [Spirulina subsalsa]|uniref:aldose epimerase family protein n=1 Tax=Spirulina subsalsa TaxID=54311 RepID=UPI00030D04CE|nr:hypothetical protein [Spirulina subsalsa]
MFAIALKQEQYQTYILTDQEAHSRIEVVPERGGIITSWRIQGQNLLYFDPERFQNPDLSIRGGIPILFPICGNLPNDLYVHQTKQYQLKQHGFARDLPWTVTEGLTQDCAGITLTLTSNDKTYSHYPFEFELQFTYQLKGNSLKILQRYINHSSVEMPFSTGLHPYFWVSDKSKLLFDLPATQYQDHLTQKTHPFKGAFDFTEPEIDLALFPLSRPSASVTNTRHNLKLTLTYSDIYSTLVFWSVQGKDYYCLEPWSAGRNALNSKENLTYLPPGETCDAWVEMTVSYC